MNFSDLAGVGKAAHGLSKLLYIIKNWFMWEKEPEKIREILDALAERNLSITEYESPTFKLKLKAAKENETIRENFNKDKVIALAAQALKQDKDISEEKVDEDWLANFFEHTKYANSEYMQKLWGKILYGEVKKPSSYSIRALQTLRFLQKKDAEKFSHICHLILNDLNKNISFIINNGKYLYDEFGISQKDLYDLEELGLIKMSTSVLDSDRVKLSNLLISEEPTTDDKMKAHFVYGGKIFSCVSFKGKDQQKFQNSITGQFPFLRLTNLGLEISKLVDNKSQLKDSYLSIIKETFKRPEVGELYMGDIIGHEINGEQHIYSSNTLTKL